MIIKLNAQVVIILIILYLMENAYFVAKVAWIVISKKIMSQLVWSENILWMIF